jgi:hypothetical protein
MQDGLATTGNGEIVLKATDITITKTIHTAGSGDVLLNATAGAVTISAQVDSNSGQIMVLANTDITQTAALSTDGTVFLDASGNITQNSSINADTVVVAAMGNIAMSATATTGADNAVLYSAEENLSVGTITGGNVTLKTGQGEITDSLKDNDVNVTADVVNIIGHGPISRVVTADELTMTTFKQNAIETKADRIFVAGNATTAGIMDVQTGQEATGILRDSKGWSVQFVNKGLFTPVMTYEAPNGIIPPVYGNPAQGWIFTKEVDYQFLNRLSGSSDTLRNTILTGQNVQNQGLQNVYTGINNYIPLNEGSYDTLNPFTVDPLSVNDYTMMPSFRTLNWDKIAQHNAEYELPFEYWIEDIVL